jgi:uncharacterized protein YgfB (UPF0149 family)
LFEKAEKLLKRDDDQQGVQKEAEEIFNFFRVCGTIVFFSFAHSLNHWL